ncbi:DUF2249 domain-containing protein [Salinactinospora qingdaonensis]|uniref:Hemerythrin HHE cation binding domain-containing protein n=1 Tax=Salinactinospora qingdaonensis TaxID=702744 RepID=A0ABP7FTM0_9ACTN
MTHRTEVERTRSTKRWPTVASRSYREEIERAVNDHALTIRQAIDRLAYLDGGSERLVTSCTAEILRHAAAEESALYPAAEERPELQALVRTMRAEHLLLRALVAGLGDARSAGESAGTAAALNTLFQAHLRTENDVLLATLAESGVDLAPLHTAVSRSLSGAGEEDFPELECGGAGDDRGSGENGTARAQEHRAGTAPELLDIRRLSRSHCADLLRVTCSTLPAGHAFVLVADRDPTPLHDMLAPALSQRFTWHSLESGPGTWRVRIAHTGISEGHDQRLSPSSTAASHRSKRLSSHSHRAVSP